MLQKVSGQKEEKIHSKWYQKKNFYLLGKMPGIYFCFPAKYKNKKNEKHKKKLELLSFRYITGKVYIVFIIQWMAECKKKKKSIL